MEARDRARWTREERMLDKGGALSVVVGPPIALIDNSQLSQRYLSSLSPDSRYERDINA